MKICVNTDNSSYCSVGYHYTLYKFTTKRRAHLHELAISLSIQSEFNIFEHMDKFCSLYTYFNNKTII